MRPTEVLKFLEKEIHTVIAATADENGLPVTCAIDIMDSDENGIYFLTAKGKGFYTRLKSSGFIAMTGMKGAHFHLGRRNPRRTDIILQPPAQGAAPAKKCARKTALISLCCLP